MRIKNLLFSTCTHIIINFSFIYTIFVCNTSLCKKKMTLMQVERVYALIICRYRSFIVPPLTASSCLSSSPRTKSLLESLYRVKHVHRD